MRQKKRKKQQNGPHSASAEHYWPKQGRSQDAQISAPPSQDRPAPSPQTNRQALVREGLPEEARSARSGLLLYGYHPVMAALSNPIRHNRHLFASQSMREQLDSHLLKAADNVTILTKPQLDQLVKTKAETSGPAPHQGLVLSADPLETLDLAEILDQLERQAKHQARIVILDQVTDPRNVGAILRSASAFGAKAMLMTSRHAPDESGALAKAAAGALEVVPIIKVVNLARALEQLKDADFSLIGLEASGTQRLESYQRSERLGLILGAEGTGMRRLTKKACDGLVAIEMTQASESLNVSVAAAIALYATRALLD